MGTSVAMLRKIFLLLGLERNVYSCVLTDGLTSVIMPISCLWLTTLHLILSWAAYELYAGVGPICCYLSFRRRPKQKWHASVTSVFLTSLLIFHSSKPAWRLHQLRDIPVPAMVEILQILDLKRMCLGNECRIFSSGNLHH